MRMWKRHAGARIQGLIWHAGMWGICSYFFLPRPAILIWGLFVAMHAISEIPRIFAAAPSEASLPDSVPAGRPDAVERESDPFLAELTSALDALQKVAEKKGLPAGIDLQALRDAAHELRRRHLALDGLAEPAARDRLTSERDDALSQAAKARDPRTIEVLQQQARSVSERIGALEQAADASARLQARERTLLHQIEALRLSILQSGVDEERSPDLAGEVRRLQLELKADAEVEAHLARARIGTRQNQ
jgi:hypothetical protein